MFKALAEVAAFIADITIRLRRIMVDTSIMTGFVVFLPGYCLLGLARYLYKRR